MPVRAILGVEVGALITVARPRGMNAWVAMDARRGYIRCDEIRQILELMLLCGPSSLRGDGWEAGYRRRTSWERSRCAEQFGDRGGAHAQSVEESVWNLAG